MITLPWKIGWAHFNQGPKVNAPCIQPNRKSDMLYLHIIPSQTTISSHPEIADRLLKWARFPLSTQSLLSAPQTDDPFKTWIRWSHFSEQNFLLSSSPSETKPKRALTMTPHPQGSAPESPDLPDGHPCLHYVDLFAVPWMHQAGPIPRSWHMLFFSACNSLPPNIRRACFLFSFMFLLSCNLFNGAFPGNFKITTSLLLHLANP